MTFEALGSEGARVLEVPFAEEEVLVALSSLCWDDSFRANQFHYGVLENELVFYRI